MALSRSQRAPTFFKPSGDNARGGDECGSSDGSGGGARGGCAGGGGGGGGGGSGGDGGVAVAYADAALAVAVAVAAMVEVTDAAAAMVVAAAANLGHQLAMQFPFPQLVRVQWTAARAAAVVAAHGLQVHVHVVQQSKSVC